MKSNRGFTLVEMLVVLAIMAMTVVLSLPFVRKSGDVRSLEAAAQVIAARLRQAQAESVGSNAERFFKIDLKNATLLEPKYALPSGTSLHIETAEGQITGDLATIRFFADGSTTGGKIILNKGDNKIELDINWLDGAVILAKVPNP
jgi:general secretion pathway protein H